MPKNLRISFVLAALLAVALFLASSKHAPVVHASDGDEDFVAGEVVVQLTSTANLAGVAGQHGLDPNPVDQFGSRAIYRLRITDGGRVENRVDELLNDNRVLFAEPNYFTTNVSASWLTAERQTCSRNGQYS